MVFPIFGLKTEIVVTSCKHVYSYFRLISWSRGGLTCLGFYFKYPLEKLSVSWLSFTSPESFSFSLLVW